MYILYCFELIVFQAENIKENTGYHTIGFLLDTNRDNAGRSNSVFFAGTDEGMRLKQKFGTKIDAQIIDLESMLRMTEMDDRGADRQFRNLHEALIRGPQEQKGDWGRRALRLLFQWNTCM